MSGQKNDSFEYLGFVLWISVRIFVVIFLIWSLIPDYIIVGYTGITYYPSKQWSILILTYFAITFFSIAFFYVGYNHTICNEWDCIHMIKDESSIKYESAFQTDLSQMKQTLLLNEKYIAQKQQERKARQENEQRHNEENKTSDSDFIANFKTLPPVPSYRDLNIKYVNHVLFD